MERRRCIMRPGMIMSESAASLTYRSRRPLLRRSEDRRSEERQVLDSNSGSHLEFYRGYVTRPGSRSSVGKTLACMSRCEVVAVPGRSVDPGERLEQVGYLSGPVFTRGAMD